MSEKGYSANLALNWTPWAFCTAVLGLRIYIRIALKVLGIGDYLMTVSWLCLTASNGLYQATEYAYYFTPDTIGTQWNAEDHAEDFLLYMCFLLARASVAALLLQLIGFTSRWRRILVFVSMSVLVAVTLMVVIPVVVPPCEYQESTFANGACIPDTRIVDGIFSTWNFYSAFVDLLYSLLPLSVFYLLRISKKKKAGLVSLFCLGWVTATCSVLRAVASYAWSPDSRVGSKIEAIASALEPPLLIICGSLGTLAPVFEYWGRGKAMGHRTPTAITRWRPALQNGGQGEKDQNTEARGDSAVGLLPAIEHPRTMRLDMSEDHAI